MDKIFSNPDITAIVMTFAVPIVVVIGYYWHNVAKTRSNNELKQSMLDRGMSAAEIEQVMNAGTRAAKKHDHKAN